MKRPIDTTTPDIKSTIEITFAKTLSGNCTVHTDPELNARLARIEHLLTMMVEHEPPKEYYTTAEVAKILGRAEFTVREWCRQNRVWAEKRACGRGRSREWMISRVELERIQNEGLLPL